MGDAVGPRPCVARKDETQSLRGGFLRPGCALHRQQPHPVNFLAVAAPDVSHEASFDTLLRSAAALGTDGPLARATCPFATGTLFAREHGKTGQIARDLRTGSWLLAAGAWFTEGGLATGDEGKLLEEYLEEGLGRLTSELDGFFCLVIADARLRQLIAVTDPIRGGFAFERALAGGGVALAGSSLLLASHPSPSLDTLALQEYLRTGAIFEDRTLFAGVRRLAPGSVLRWDAAGRRLSSERWWRLESVPRARYSGDEAAEALHQSLVRAVRRASRLGKPACD